MIVRGDLKQMKQMSKSKVQRKKTVRARPPHKCVAVAKWGTTLSNALLQLQKSCYIYEQQSRCATNAL